MKQDPAAPARGWRSDLVLVRQRNLGLLVGSRFVSVLGTGMTPVALAFAVLALPGGDAGTLGLVLFAAAVPEVVFMLFGGVIADRFRRSRVMVLSESLAAFAQVSTAVLFLTGRATIPLLAVLAAASGLAIALFSPALTGIVPEVAIDEHLQSANALLRLATNLARIAGVAVGGILVATVGPGWALLADGLTFAVSALLIAAIRTTRTVASDGQDGVWSQLRHGWREFVARRWVVVIVVLFSLANVGFSAAVGVLGPVQAQEALGGPGPWAAIVTAFSVGTVVGVVVALRVRPTRPMAVAVCAAPVLALPIAADAPPLALWVIVAAAFLGGVSIDIFSVLWDTALQQHIPPESLSRVSAYDWLGSTALVPIGLALAGPLVAAIGVKGALLVASTLALLPLAALLDPQVRRLRAGRPQDYLGNGSSSSGSPEPAPPAG